MEKTLYELLKDAGQEIENHESDLYVKATPEARQIIRHYEKQNGPLNAKPFTDNIDGASWIEIPFHFAPFWDKEAEMHQENDVDEGNQDNGLPEAIDRLRQLSGLSPISEQSKFDAIENPVTKTGKPYQEDPFKIRGTAQLPDRIVNSHGDNPMKMAKDSMMESWNEFVNSKTKKK